MYTPHAWQPAGWGSALWQCECDVRVWTLSPHTEARERLHAAHRLTGVQATWQQEHCCSCSRTSCILHKVILQQKGIVLSGKLCLPAPTGDCITKHSAQRMSDLQNTSTYRQAWYTSRDAGEMHGRDAGVEMQGREHGRLHPSPITGNAMAMASLMGRPHPSPTVGNTKQSMVL